MPECNIYWNYLKNLFIVFELIPTAKGGNYALFLGYLYTKKKSSEAKEYWACIEKCGASLITLRNSTMVDKQKGSHSYSADSGKISVKKATAEIAHRMKSTTNPYPLIYRQVTAIYSQTGTEFLSKMPIMENMCILKLSFSKKN